MERFGNNVWLGVTNAIYTIHSVDDPRQMVEVFMNQINWLIPFDRAMFFVKDSYENAEVNLPVCINISDTYAKMFCKQIERYDSTFGLKNGGNSIIYKESDVVDPKLFKLSCFYNEFCKPNHIEYVLHMILCFNNKCVGNMILFRDDNTRNACDFSERDVFILNQVKDHLAIGLNRMLLMNSAISTINDSDVISSNKGVFVEELFASYGLTLREKEILMLLAEGNQNELICDELSISANTLKKHTSNIYRKLNINSRTELMRLVHQSTTEKSVIV